MIKTVYKNGYRFRIIKGKTYPSVTSVLKLLPKSESLTVWKIKQALLYIQKIGNLETDTIKKALLQYKAVAGKTADEGNNYHKMIQDYELKNKWVKHPVLNKWIKQFKQPIEFQGTKAEEIIWNDELMTSGAVDLFGYGMQTPMIIDLKRANKVWLSHIIQTSVYGYMWKKKYPEFKKGLGLGIYAMRAKMPYYCISNKEQEMSLKIFKLLRMLFQTMWKEGFLK